MSISVKFLAIRREKTIRRLWARKMIFVFTLVSIARHGFRNCRRFANNRNLFFNLPDNSAASRLYDRRRRINAVTSSVCTLGCSRLPLKRELLNLNRSVGRFSSLHACLLSVSRALTDQIIVRCRISEYRFQGSVSPFRLPIISLQPPSPSSFPPTPPPPDDAASSSSRDHLPEMINGAVAGGSELFGRTKIMLEKSTPERTCESSKRRFEGKRQVPLI